MAERLLKITYHGAATGTAKKINAYLRMPSAHLHIDMIYEIKMYLFQKRQLPKTEIRTYWIDTDSDEIEIVNQNDYDIFLSKCEKNMHLQISSAGEEKVEAKQASATTADDPTNFIIHDGVQCDACGTLPMIGFRYKCVQCPNFDLCQNCEAAHKHPEHLMVRMPTNNGPSVIDAWLSGPGSSSHHHRRSSRRFRGQCPFGEAAATATATASAQTTPAGDSHKESRRDRRSSRRHGGLMSHFVEMMMNLPEAATSAATPAATAPSAPADPTNNTKETQAKTEEPTAATSTNCEANSAESTPVEEPTVTANVEEPVAAPRTKEQPKPEAAPTANSTPTTPVISLENLAQMVNPEYMRAGIEILNNFSEMFAKMIDPNEAAAFGCADTSMAANSSSVPKKSETVNEPPVQNPVETAASTTSMSLGESIDSHVSTVDETIQAAPAAPALAASIAAPTSTAPVAAPTAAAPIAVTLPVPAANLDTAQRRRSDSLDQDWQMIDNSATPISNVSSTDALINLNSTSVNSATNTDASVSPARDYVQLGEMLRQHITEEQQREQTTAHTQTSQVDTVSTSTSTNSVATNSTSTSTTNARPLAPEEKRSVPIYHTDENINAAVHAMMAMGFSNEGAWLTQLLESVEGNIPAALDIMHTSQSGRN
ncbi:hypothetical protein KR093_003466 [Drosophila rubida]|uniref:Protein ref(2)P n=1 Tax=Drosophila rubida TaxID=30044 RepID=A0AAD4K404_9MUSC|nr:hypothetical protein KR093_003466 [Drosophila rubida]